MKKILKILIALSIALMLYIVISVSFTTVKAGNVYSAPATREFYYNGHHYITFMLNNSTATIYGTVHDPDCPCHKY